MILLDTWALLWLDSDRDAFTERARKTLARHADGLAVSPASFMEIGIKMAKGKLELPMPLRSWVEQVCDHYALHVIPVSREVAVAFCELPPLHNDPFDRLIIATARANQLAVVTADAVYSTYGGIEVIW